MNSYSKSNFFKEGENISVFKKNNTFFVEHPHTHDFIEIVYIVSGKAKQEIDGAIYEAESGSLLFLNYGQTHAFISDNMTYYNIMLTPEAVSEKIINTDNAFEILSLTAFEDFRAADTSCPFVRFDGKQKLAVEQVVEEMYREYTKGEYGCKTVLGAYLTVLLTYIFRAMLPEKGILKSIPSEITQYIETHFKEKLSLELLARKCFYSPKYFCRIFKECYGITMSEYIKKLRLEQACRLLSETNMTIEDICNQVGYDDTSRFYKYFKEMYKITPKEYKKTAAKKL